MPSQPTDPLSELRASLRRDPRRSPEHMEAQDMTQETMDPTLFSRQSKLEVIVPDTITVIGCGGIGYYVAFNAAMLGSKKIILFDADAVENHNRGRLPLSESDVTRNKAEVLREHIYRVRPNVTVLAMPTFVDEFSLEQLEGFIYICTDTFSSQKMIREWCVTHNLPFLRIGYDGRNMTIENKPNTEGVWDLLGDDGRYTVVPSYALTPQIAALTAMLLSDMNVWIGYPQKIPQVDISGNVFQLGQAILEGRIFQEPMKFPDRRADEAQWMEERGGRIRV